MMRTPLLVALLAFCSLSRSSTGSITFPINATLVACPTDLSTPTQLASFSGGSLLVSPTSQEGDLCILSRVNRNDTSKKVYIPMARSYDGNDWHRVEGRYVSFVTAQCGEAAIDGVGFSAGDYLCEIAVPQLDSGNLGYFLTKWDAGSASNRRKAARFLERATWGPRHVHDSLVIMVRLLLQPFPVKSLTLSL
ncbi:hypothetical protein HJC23_002117 [Cyclotella cryptica]|uniref:Uncharacterized protein n=1 Tax=Cyclotella cryptica TaxID=29204 RepID=A0ABD3Q0F0_9STRA